MGSGEAYSLPGGGGVTIRVCSVEADSSAALVAVGPSAAIAAARCTQAVPPSPPPPPPSPMPPPPLVPQCSWSYAINVGTSSPYACEGAGEALHSECASECAQRRCQQAAAALARLYRRTIDAVHAPYGCVALPDGIYFNSNLNELPTDVNDPVVRRKVCRSCIGPPAAPPPPTCPEVAGRTDLGSITTEEVWCYM